MNEDEASEKQESVEPEQHEDANEGGKQQENSVHVVDPYTSEAFSKGLEVNLRYRASSFKKVILDEL